MTSALGEPLLLLLLLQVLKGLVALVESSGILELMFPAHPRRSDIGRSLGVGPLKALDTTTYSSAGLAHLLHQHQLHRQQTRNVSAASSEMHTACRTQAARF